MFRKAFATRPEVIWTGGLLAIAGGAVLAMGDQVPTTILDFFGPGTQPLQKDFVPIFGPEECFSCHGNYDEVHEPGRNWAASPMGQAARDPAFYACLAIANQDAAFAGELCLRCHTPGGWLAGNSNPPDGSALNGSDFAGVSCHVCHRMVDPLNHPGAPTVDSGIINALADVPPERHTGHMVIDPQDRRRGPYDLGFFFVHDWVQSPFHQKSEMCATCHDVNNPIYLAQPDGTYTLTPLDEPHPTHRGADEFPVERTYGEWSQSAFGAGPVDMGGRFGGANPLVSSCQDCHMPEDPGMGCFFGEERDDLGTHQFNGGNTWLLNAVRMLYEDFETQLDDDSVAASIARTEQMLRSASDLELTAEGSTLNVRVINQGGHKLPTGYPEGRRMWVNVQFYDNGGALIDERGAYNFATADLETGDTKVYEAKLGISPDIAALTGKPAGEGFHFALNNMWVLDNRIPPRGFTNAGFESVQAQPRNYTYADGQYWDDTLYAAPAGAARADVRVYYQSLSKEYVEFLRDENVTNDAGQVFYNVWAATGMSTPVEMDFASIPLNPGCNAADFSAAFGTLDINDILTFATAFNAADASADLFPSGGDGTFDINDVLIFAAAFNAGCP